MPFYVRSTFCSSWCEIEVLFRVGDSFEGRVCDRIMLLELKMSEICKSDCKSPCFCKELGDLNNFEFVRKDFKTFEQEE